MYNKKKNFFSEKAGIDINVQMFIQQYYRNDKGKKRGGGGGNFISKLMNEGSEFLGIKMKVNLI